MHTLKAEQYRGKKQHKTDTNALFCFHLKNAISTQSRKIPNTRKRIHIHIPYQFIHTTHFCFAACRKDEYRITPMNYVNKFRGRQKTMIKKVTFGSLPIPDQPTRRRDEVFSIDCCARKMSKRGH
jgi:hypothetical protein